MYESNPDAKPDCWVYLQREFRSGWKAVVWSYAQKTFPHKLPNSADLDKSRVRLDPEGITITVSSFLDLLKLSFASLPWPCLRMCPAKHWDAEKKEWRDCKHKYYVAHHLKQIYCGDPECTQWGDRKSKLSWYHENKEESPKKRRRRR